MGPEALGFAKELGAVGVVGFLLILVVRYLLTSFSKSMNAMNDRINANTTVVLNLQQLIIRHDAQVRGINPTTGPDLDERVAGAIRYFDEANRLLETQKEMIGRLKTNPD
jgi:hypothetical protein